jgi:hypothetical protein
MPDRLYFATSLLIFDPAIVETGIYLGTTTDFLADTGLPIYRFI